MTTQEETEALEAALAITNAAAKMYLVAGTQKPFAGFIARVKKIALWWQDDFERHHSDPKASRYADEAKHLAMIADLSEKSVIVARALLSSSAAARGMREALEWQPMNTAPRDGEDVLLCFRSRRHAIAWGNHHDLDWVTSDDDTPLPEPIAWMRLRKRAALSPNRPLAGEEK